MMGNIDLRTPPVIAPTAAPQAPTCRVFQDFAALAGLREEWDSLAAETADVYASFDWCRIWWQHYSYRRRLCVLAFRAGPRLVGLLPIHIERLWLGPVPLRIARLLGSDSTLAVLNPAVRPEWALQVYAEAMRQLLCGQHADLIAFGPLSGEHPHELQIRAACRATAPQTRLLHDRVIGVHASYALPEDFETYLRAVKPARRNLQRGWRNLTAAHQAEMLTVAGPEALSLYEEFVNLHTAQWQPLHKLGHFGDWPAAVDFNRDLLRTLTLRGRAGFHLLRADGRNVAMVYFLRFGAHEHWRLAAREIGPAWERVPLGILVQLHATEAAINSGVRRADDGPGRYQYKTALGATEYPLHSVLVARGTLGRLKADGLCRVSDLVHLLYYRIWFGRIAPRLPLQRRSLSTLWMRYRV